MSIKTLRVLYFSPTGTSRKVAMAMAEAFPGPSVVHDLLRSPLVEPLECAEDELVVVSMPVFVGRIPDAALTGLNFLRGRGGRALPVVLYGNRAYEDALLELSDILVAAGFHVGGGAAFVGQHSIFPEVAAARPDADDLRLAGEFMRRALAGFEDASRALPSIPGNRPYREPHKSGVQPSVGDACTLCGLCVRLCPTRALRVQESKLVHDAALCISCAACVAACPSMSMRFTGPEYAAAAVMFAEKFKTPRRDAELFL